MGRFVNDGGAGLVRGLSSTFGMGRLRWVFGCESEYCTWSEGLVLYYRYTVQNQQETWYAFCSQSNKITKTFYCSSPLQ
jgi:hypothetical protein